MTVEEKKEALKYIESQLKFGYLDLGSHEQDEFELIKDALEKQKEKTPYDKSNNPDEWHIVCCPSCHRTFWNSGNWVHYEPEWCDKCGQKLDWSYWHPYRDR